MEVMDYSYRSIDENRSWSCPVVMAWVRGQHVQAVLDTGCLQFLIRDDVVPQEQVKGSTPIRLTYIHGEATQYERKFVPIRLMEYQGELRIRVN